MTNLGTVLGAILRDKERLKEGVHDTGEAMTYLLGANGSVQIYISSFSINYRDYNLTNNIGIWGHPTKGIWGTNKWGTDATAFDSWVEAQGGTPAISLLVKAGVKQIEDWFYGKSVDNPAYLAIGTGTSDITTDDTTLDTEITRISHVSAEGIGTVLYTATFNTLEGNANDLQEAGIFDDSSSGNMYLRFDFNPFDKDNLKELKVVLFLSISAKLPVTNRGTEKVIDFLSCQTPTQISHMAWGNGTTAVTISDTTMESELQRNTAITDSSYGTYSWNGLLQTSQPSGQPTSVTRTALFDASSSGNMCFIAEHASINKTSRLEIETKHTVGFKNP